MSMRSGLRASVLIAAFAAVPFSVSLAVDTPPQKEASIPFANKGGIRDWEADHDRGLWVQDVHRNWYYAKLMGPCTGLNFANTIAFDTSPMGTFDRFSAIIVPHHGRCVVQTFEPSGAPPKHKKKQMGTAPAEPKS